MTLARRLIAQGDIAGAVDAAARARARGHTNPAAFIQDPDPPTPVPGSALSGDDAGDDRALDRAGTADPGADRLESDGHRAGGAVPRARRACVRGDGSRARRWRARKSARRSARCAARSSKRSRARRGHDVGPRRGGAARDRRRGLHRREPGAAPARAHGAPRWSCSTSSPTPGIASRSRSSRASRASSSWRATSATARSSAACSRRDRPRAVLNLAAETHVDRSIDDPSAFVDTNVRRQLRPARGGAAALARARRAGAQRLPLPARLDRRGLRLDRAGRARRRGGAARAELALLGEQGGGRPADARLASHLRPARAGDAQREQLRPLPASRRS